jgi:ribosomal protein S18 acetylase RimI-like enzyme
MIFRAGASSPFRRSLLKATCVRLVLEAQHEVVRRSKSARCTLRLVLLTIRSAVPGDEPLLANLNAFVHDLHASHRPDYFKSPSLPTVAASYSGLLRDPATHAWIAEVDGAAAGYILTVINDRPGDVFRHARRWCEIAQICIAPAHRQHGIARALVERALSHARSLGIAEFELTIWSFNTAALKTFEHLGFTPKVTRFELKPGSG